MNDYVPSEFYLGQNYPNPFKEKTSIKYCVAYKTRVEITIYDSENNKIKKLVDEIKEAGTYEVKFSSPGNNNETSKSETYFYSIIAGNFSNTKTMIYNKNIYKVA